MRRGIAQLVPEPELLNLIFGVLAAALINVITSLALGGFPQRIANAALGAAFGLGLMTVSIGGLVLLAGRSKEDALLSGAGNLSRRELTAQFRYELERRAILIVLFWICVILGVALAVGFFLWGFGLGLPAIEPTPVAT